MNTTIWNFFEKPMKQARFKIELVVFKQRKDYFFAV